MDYTLAQFHAYLDLAATRERQERRWHLIATAAATQGGEALKKLLKELK
jgi:hypothetical protein